ncbi:hypothetical protein TcCL_ESM03526 [Trypanosoma cruzi]|nr:hypothetical protein TcCL_ESM03526 [Trypanosoma cruzi]
MSFPATMRTASASSADGRWPSSSHRMDSLRQINGDDEKAGDCCCSPWVVTETRRRGRRRGTCVGAASIETGATVLWQVRYLFTELLWRPLPQPLPGESQERDEAH